MAFDNSAFTEPQSAEDKALVFELSGHEVGWLVDGLAIQRAAGRGHQLGDILSELQSLDALKQAENVQEAANRFADVYPALAKLVWLGMIRFNEDVSQDAILGALDNDAMGEIPVAEMMERIFPSQDEEMPEDLSDAEGKPNGGG
jgi:hypothetical protein